MAAFIFKSGYRKKALTKAKIESPLNYDTVFESVRLMAEVREARQQRRKPEETSIDLCNGSAK